MYVKYLENVKSALIESTNSSQLYITNTRLDCWYGYFEENTAVIITKAEYDYDTKTYLLSLRDLYHNNDKIRILAKDEEFKRAFRRCDRTDEMYKEYREKVNKYYSENVQAYDFITVLLTLIVVLLVIDIAGIVTTSLGMLVLNGLAFAALWITFGTLIFLLICTITYKGYVRYIAKKGNWSGMIEEEQLMREKLAEDIEKYIAEISDKADGKVEGDENHIE